MTILFFGVCGLDILNSLDVIRSYEREQIIEWIYAQQVLPDSTGETTETYCGFRGGSFLGVPFDSKKVILRDFKLTILFPLVSFLSILSTPYTWTCTSHPLQHASRRYTVILSLVPISYPSLQITSPNPLYVTPHMNILPISPDNLPQPLYVTPHMSILPISPDNLPQPLICHPSYEHPPHLSR